MNHRNHAVCAGRAGAAGGGSAVTGVDWERTGTTCESRVGAGALPMINLSQMAACWNDMSAASMLYGAAVRVPCAGEGLPKG